VWNEGRGKMGGVEHAIKVLFALRHLCNDAGAVREVPPFAIISSSEVDHEVGRYPSTNP